MIFASLSRAAARGILPPPPPPPRPPRDATELF
jgi:hypothetical protein